MNDRLEIASRLMAGALADTRSTASFDDIREKCLEQADAFIAEEARTRKAEAVSELVAVGGEPRFVPPEVADELAKLRQVAAKAGALKGDDHGAWVKVKGQDRYTYRLVVDEIDNLRNIGRELTQWVDERNDGCTHTTELLAAARALGLGGGE